MINPVRRRSCCDFLKRPPAPADRLGWVGVLRFRREAPNGGPRGVQGGEPLRGERLPPGRSAIVASVPNGNG